MRINDEVTLPSTTTGHQLLVTQPAVGFSGVTPAPDNPVTSAQSIDRTGQMSQDGGDGVSGDDVLNQLVWLGHNTDAGLRFLWNIYSDLSPTDLARCLEFAWTSGQYGETMVGRTPSYAKLYRVWWYLMFHAATPLHDAPSIRRLPETVTVFRGVPAWNKRQARERMGHLAWTTKRDVAESFANRWRTSDLHVYGRQRIPFVGCTVVPKTAVLAHFDNKEAEVVLDFQKIRRVSVSPLMGVDNVQAVKSLAAV